MSRDDPFLVRHSSLPAVGESNGERAVINRMGSIVVTDLFTQLVLAGFAYHMQIGTEDAPVNSTATIDDQLGWMLVDNPSGSALIPLLYEVNIGNFTTATTIISMLEVDNAKARYSSGGSAFVPANMRTDDPRSATGVFIVGTDITVAAKTAVPGSIELARVVHSEDAIGDPAGAALRGPAEVYSVRTRPVVCIVDVGSVVAHHGAATADCSSYGVLQFAQFDRALVV